MIRSCFHPTNSCTCCAPGLSLVTAHTNDRDQKTTRRTQRNPRRRLGLRPREFCCEEAASTDSGGFRPANSPACRISGRIAPRRAGSRRTCCIPARPWLAAVWRCWSAYSPAARTSDRSANLQEDSQRHLMHNTGGLLSHAGCSARAILRAPAELAQRSGCRRTIHRRSSPRCRPAPVPSRSASGLRCRRRCARRGRRPGRRRR